MFKSCCKFISVRVSLIVLWLFIITAQSISAQENELNAHPALWMIDDGQTKTYILGSVHLLPDDIKWYGGELKEIVEEADEYVFEVHMTPEKVALSRSITLANGLLENGDLLSNYLEADEYSFLIKTATALGIPETSIAGFKPWFASIALSVSSIIKEGWNPESGVDRYIEKIAAKKGAKISSLETIEAQMSTLYDHPMDVQSAMLKDTLVQLKDIKALTLEMVSSWSSGDLDKMAQTFLEPMKEQPAIFEKLVTRRNNNWVPVIKRLIANDQTTLIVAGTAHFIGEGGVINLLKQNGYDVKRIQ